MAKVTMDITWNVELTHDEMKLLYKIADKIGFLKEPNVSLTGAESEMLAELAAKFSGVTDIG